MKTLKQLSPEVLTANDAGRPAMRTEVQTTPSSSSPAVAQVPTVGDPVLPSALVFGREDRGLSNDELLQAGRLLQIPTPTPHGSLNLSHAVAVVLHDLHRLTRPVAPDRAAPATAVATVSQPPCPRGVLEAMFSDAEELLLEVGFLLPHTAHARMAKLRALLQRGQVSAPEVALLRGLVCQLRWASRRPFPSFAVH